MQWDILVIFAQAIQAGWTQIEPAKSQATLNKKGKKITKSYKFKFVYCLKGMEAPPQAAGTTDEDERGGSAGDNVTAAQGQAVAAAP